MDKYRNNRDRDSRFGQRNGKALPEPRLVKRQIIQKKNQAKKDVIKLRKRKSTHLIMEAFGSIAELFMDLQVYMDKLPDHKNYPHLEKLKKMLETGAGKPTKDDAQRLVQTYWEINDLIYELGITDIVGAADNSQPFGHDFLEGLSMELNTKYAAWERLKENMRNMTRLLQEDADFMVVVTSETSGLGKSTLMTALLEEMNTEQKQDCGKENLVFTDNDFWNAFDLPATSTFGIDEGQRLLYSKNAIKGKQKKRKTKIKTGRYNNLGIMACFHDFYDLDKEMINTNVNANIHLPQKGYFEFYSKKQIEEFEKDDNGKCQRNTDPAFEGYFPDYSGEMWKVYKDNEEKKDQGIREQEDEDSGNDKSAHCNRCGYDWTPKKDNVEKIRQCPKCHSRNWNEEKDPSDDDD